MQRTLAATYFCALFLVPALMAQTVPPATGRAAFSQIAIGGGVSAMGVNMQVATNINRRLNVRATGNYFRYTVNNITVANDNGASGVEVTGELNFATAGVSLDYYPFPNRGFRLSPGVIFYNQNQVRASGATTAGSSVTFGSQTYYSDAVNPMAMQASLGLNARQQAFSMTTGWGNMIPPRGGHWSFPFELGAVFTGVPALNMTVTGYGCDSAAHAANNDLSYCVNMATNATAQQNINAQITQYKNDLDSLKVYPILSFGVAYSFGIR